MSYVNLVVENDHQLVHCASYGTGIHFSLVFCAMTTSFASMYNVGISGVTYVIYLVCGEIVGNGKLPVIKKVFFV